MATRLFLDAMIKRADFWQGGPSKTESATPLQAITFENLRSDSSFVLNLRKPDFQRETNQWTILQSISFIQSFIDGELVPSIILWLSPEGLNFVIDGAHRLSALRAWMEDDYGDGPGSIAFFGSDIPKEQKDAAKKMRAKVESVVGSYKSLGDKLKARNANPSVVYDNMTSKRLKHYGSRQLDLQWVGGDADVAEVSFFKINTQGTPLDKTEEELLRNRSRAPAIAARSMVRAAAGHKYWSKFDESHRKTIEALSQQINSLLFQPELETPIRTMCLPLGGASSNLEALAFLVRLLSITEGTLQKRRVALKDTEVDETGDKTIAALQQCLAVVNRITGKDRASMGLHPVVYFYSERGNYLSDMFLGIAYLFKTHLLNNNGEFWKKFTKARPAMEDFLLNNKLLLGQVLLQIRSRDRIERVADILAYLVEAGNTGYEMKIEHVAQSARLKGSIVALQEKVEGRNFSTSASSSVFLKDAGKTMLKCPICGGYLEPYLSSSLDHKVRKQDGGTGDPDNGQLTHFYCNTGVKG